MTSFKKFDDIVFEEENHEYFYKGVKCGISGTSFIHQYANEFNESKFSEEKVAEWHEERDYSCIKGNEIHLYCQGLWNGTPYSTDFSLVEPRFRNRLHLDIEILKRQAMAFYGDYNGMLELIKDEQLIYDDDYDVAGAIDLLFRNKLTGNFVICDLKSNKEIKYEAFRKKAMKIPLTELQDCNFIHYSLQVYLYKNIFEKNTGFITEDPFIIHFDVTKDNYTLIEPKKLDKEVLKILEMRRRKNMKSLPILLIGRSGSGKSASLRNFKKEEVGVINVIGKELPFKNDLKYAYTDDYKEVLKSVTLTNKKTIIIDDAGYLITNYFMRNHSKGGGGNAVFEVYNKLADNFWDLIEKIKKIDGGKTVYFIMHEETNDSGITKPKTIGKLLDEKVCIEGMFTIALRSMMKDGKYVIRTKTDGSDIVKTPMGMFEETEVDNDLKEIDKKIREYYNLDEEEKVEVVEEKTEGKETEKESKKEEEIK